MFVPYLTPYLTREDNNVSTGKKTLEKRRGGGGGGRGGGSGGGGKSGGGSSGGSGSGGRTMPIPNAGGSRGSATPYGNGGGKVTTIGAGNAFAGRPVGGGQRGQVYGSQTYGSGYPGYGGYGVAGRGFPFGYWPLAWGGVGLVGGGAYLHHNEYGRSDNSSRPGGPMTQIMFASASPTSGSNSTFYVIADNMTTTSLLDSITSNCTSFISTSVSTKNGTVPPAYNETIAGSPKPEQVVQYYRASSVALALAGYNDTAALAENVTGPINNTPLPNNVDRNLLDCLNYTIGEAVPLLDSGGVRWQGGMGLQTSGLVWVLWYLVGGV